MIAGTLEIQLLANMARLQKDMDDAKRSVGGAMASIEKAVGVAKAALGGLTAGLSVGALVGFAKKVGDSVDAMNDLKDATGASIENISALEDVARRTGSSFDTVSTALVKMNQGLSAAKSGSDAEKAFKALGLSVVELKRLDPGEAMRVTAVALSGFADDANKARITQELFGKSLKEVAPFLKDLAEAGELHATVTTREAEEAENLNKHLFVLQKNALDASRSLLSNMLPAINAVIDAMKKGGLSAGLDELGNRLFDWEGNQARKSIKRMTSDLADLREAQAAITMDVFGKKGAIQQEIDTKIAMLDAAKKAYFKLTDGGLGGGRGSVNPGFVEWRETVGEIAETAKAVKANTAALKEQQERMKMGREVAMAMGDAVTAANEAEAKSLADVVKEHEKFTDALEKSADSVGVSVQKLQDEEAALIISAAQHITLAQAIEQVEIARLQEARAVQLSYGDDVAAAAIQREIDMRRELATLIGAKEAREANAKAVDELAKANQKAAEESEKFWTDALMRGFENGKGFFENMWDAIRNKLKTDVLKVFVQPVSMGITGMMGMSGTANAGSMGGLGDIASMFSGASTATSGLGWLTNFGGSVASSAGSLGSWLSGTSSESMQQLGGMIGRNTSAIGNYAQVAGDALGYLNTAVLASEGKWGAAIGSGLGTYFGGPIGSAIGGAIGGFVDDAFSGGHEYTTGSGISGHVSSAGFSGSNYQDWKNDGSSGFFGIGGARASSGRNFSALDGATTRQFSAAFAGVQSAAAGMATALGLDAKKITEYSQDISVALGSDAEANKKAIESLFKGVADGMAAKVAPKIAELAKDGETASVTLARLSGSITTANGWLSILRQRLFQVSLAGGDAASKLADAFGGLDQLSASSKAFYDSYYTEGEKVANSQRLMTDALSAVGLALPTSKDALRDLAATLDLNTDAGRRAYATLLTIAPEFASTADATARMARDIADATAKLASDTAAHLMHAFTGARALVPALDAAALNISNLTSGVGTMSGGMSDAQVKTLALATGLTEAQVRAGALTDGLASMGAWSNSSTGALGGTSTALSAAAYWANQAGGAVGAMSGGMSDAQVKTLALATGLTEAQVRAGALTDGLASMGAWSNSSTSALGGTSNALSAAAYWANQAGGAVDAMSGGMSDAQVKTLALATGLTEAQVRAGALTDGLAAMGAWSSSSTGALGGTSTALFAASDAAQGMALVLLGTASPSLVQLGQNSSVLAGVLDTTTGSVSTTAARLLDAQYGFALINGAMVTFGTTTVTATGALSSINSVMGDANSGVLTFGTGVRTLQGAYSGAQLAGLVLNTEIEGLRTKADKAVINIAGLSTALATVNTETFVSTVGLVFENLATRISDVIDSISAERVALREAALQIINPTVMSKTQINAGISAINTSLPSNAALQQALPVLEQWRDRASNWKIAGTAANAYAMDYFMGPNATQLGRAWVREFYESGRGTDGAGTSLGALPVGAGSIVSYADIEGDRNYDIINAGKAYMGASIDVYLGDMLKAAQDAAKAATLAYADAMQNFAIDASKSVGKLTRLREETVRYYDAQKQLADLMSTSAAGLRTTVADYRYAQKTPEQQVTELQGKFSSAYSLALAAQGDGATLASYGDKLNSMLGPLIDKLGETGKSNLVDSYLAQAESIAKLLEDTKPMNYQADSLAMLGNIDATLAALDASSQSAEKIITAAINAGADKTAAGLHAVIAALTGQSIPAFATGAAFTNGVVSRPTVFNMGLMGEAGDEGILPLANIGGRLGVHARFGGGQGGNTARLEALVERLVQQNEALTSELVGLRLEARATASNTGKTAKILTNITPNGDAIATTVAA